MKRFGETGLSFDLDARPDEVLAALKQAFGGADPDFAEAAGALFAWAKKTVVREAGGPSDRNPPQSF